MSDVATLIWKEWKENLFQRGFRGLPSTLITLAVFGVVLPLQFGAAMLESPAMMFVWSWVPLFLTASILADAFAGERERHTLETLLASRLSNTSILLGKALASALYGYLTMLASVVVGTMSINIAGARDRLVLMAPDIVVGVVTIGFLICWLTATIGVQASMRSATAKQAQQIMTTAIIVIIFGGMYGVQFLPRELTAEISRTLATYTSFQLTAVVAAALSALGVITTVMAVKMFKRTETII